MLVCRNMSALLGISMPLMWRGACDDPDWGVGCRLVCGEMAKDTLDKEAQVMRPELEQLKEQINISNMVEKVPSFKGGGALWFTDLTTPDPRYMLPALTGLTFLATVELNMQEGMEGNPMANTMKKFSRVLAFMTVPFTANFPKAIFCYWITSNLFSLGYGFVLKLTRVRKFLNLPDLVPEPTKSAAQPNFTLFGASKPILPAKEESDQTNTPARRLSSSSVISQRIRNLEKTVKARNKHKKR
ncbi:mitochondrial inner membrane protein OXA1-like [Musa troglodytarum]|uniref:Mitochondrial inner membrane protein OXA1-like n=1 Tax=Musa troglodytarum TaxID=320322 RepID=A0A9E7HCX1_9LILI|nr:mitochondrial inner membrane protein OXA1-like [Musa troglodytarum]